MYLYLYLLILSMKHVPLMMPTVVSKPCVSHVFSVKTWL